MIFGGQIYRSQEGLNPDIIAQFFEAHGCPIDVVFFTNYERQVDALLGGQSVEGSLVGELAKTLKTTIGVTVVGLSGRRRG